LANPQQFSLLYTPEQVKSDIVVSVSEAQPWAQFGRSVTKSDTLC